MPDNHKIADRLRELADDIESDDEDDHPLANVFTNSKDKLVWNNGKPAVIVGYQYLSAMELDYAREEGYEVYDIDRAEYHDQGDGPRVRFIESDR